MNDQKKLYIESAVSGVIVGILSLIVEHPFDSIKTQWQANTNIQTFPKLLKFIYNKNGLSSFYNGFIPNLVRVSIKQFYRWPLVISLPYFYNEFLNNLALSKIITGLTIANLEICILNPLERLKVYAMTNHAKEKIFVKFFKLHRFNLFNELYLGTRPFLYRANASWVSFLYFDYIFKTHYKILKNTDTLSFKDLNIISVLCGIINTFIGNNNIIIIISFTF